MYRTIFVPLDGSDFSEHALPLACMLAHTSGAALHLVHVHTPVVYPSMRTAPLINETLDDESRQRERSYLEAVQERLSSTSDVKTMRVLLDGPVIDALSDYAATNDIDLVVMTTHGRGGITRLWMGSVADSLV